VREVPGSISNQDLRHTKDSKRIVLHVVVPLFSTQPDKGKTGSFSIKKHRKSNNTIKTHVTHLYRKIAE